MSYTVRFQDGDLEFGTAGDQTWITASEKAAQDLLEEVLLPYDAQRNRGNEMFKPDGSLASIVGSFQVGTSFIQTSIREATKRLMQAQSASSDTFSSEIIQRIKTIIAKPLQNDVTAYGFFLAVEVNDENIALSRAIRMGHLGNTPTPLLGGYDP